MTTILPSVIFNTEKTDYKNTPLFLGQEPGLLDSVHKTHPEIFNLYKKMKSLDWDENEFNYSTCNQEFKEVPKSQYQAMVYTLAYQWEADTVATRSIASILAPFITSSELWGATLAISTNEFLHALTYSEIVRNSFDNPEEVFEEILAVTETFSRLEEVANIFAEVYDVSHRYALKQASKEEAYDAVMFFYVALYCLERIQFISSFAVTFAFGEMGMFMPIAKAVQKICQDEFEVHQVLDRVVIQQELSTKQGIDWYNRNREKISKIINSVYESEVNWSKFICGDGRELPGLNEERLIKGVQFNAQPVYDTLHIELPFERIEKNPLPYMEDWMNVNAIQAAPQEEVGRNSAYLMGGIVDRSTPKEYDVSDL